MFVTVKTTSDTESKKEVNWTIKVIIKTPNVTYDVGDKLDLDCKVKETSKPIFAQWIKHAEDIVLENKTIPPVTDDFGLGEYRLLRHKINKVSLDQRGTYICQAKILNSSQLVTGEAHYTLRIRGNYHHHHHHHHYYYYYYYHYYYNY